MRIGLISDTHGLLRPEAIDFLRGADRIIHAGDIGAPEILDELRALAPVTAVRVHVVHDLADLDEKTSARVVISGHSHRPLIKENGGVLYVNPGSAGPRRFSLPVAVGELRISGASVRARIKELA